MVLVAIDYKTRKVEIAGIIPEGIRGDFGRGNKKQLRKQIWSPERTPGF